MKLHSDKLLLYIHEYSPREEDRRVQYHIDLLKVRELEKRITVFAPFIQYYHSEPGLKSLIHFADVKKFCDAVYDESCESRTDYWEVPCFSSVETIDAWLEESE